MVVLDNCLGIWLGDPAKRQRKNRNRMQIAADILEVAKDLSHKTRIMYQANLSSELLRKYLDALTKSGLLHAPEKGKKLFVITEKGHRFLEQFYELRHYSEIVESKRRALERDLAQVGSGLQ